MNVNGSVATWRLLEPVKHVLVGVTSEIVMSKSEEQTNIMTVVDEAL